MPSKVMILAQFGHGYYIRGTLKRLMGILDWLKAWWIRVSVKQVTDQKSMPLLPRRRGNARKSHDFGSIWPRILYPWDFEEADRFCGLAQGSVDPHECETSHRPEIHATLASPERKCPQKEEIPTKVMILAQFDHGYYIRGTLKRLMGVLASLKAWWIRTRNPCHSCLTGEEMPAKAMILAQFDHGYYIRGTLKRLMTVLACLRAWSIRFGHGYYIRGTLKRLMGVLASLKAWWIRTRNPCSHCLAGEEMPAKVMILAQFDHGYYIRGTLKRLTDVVARLKAWWIRGSVKQFNHGYYIRGTLKRLMGVLAWLKAGWIRMLWPASGLGGSIEEMPTKVMILAQFDHGYYIRGTLKRLMSVLAWLKAGWIRVSVTQVTDQKSMPLLPRWGGKVVILAQFGHRYYICGTLK
ncbi:hypothetical protein C8R44DRAFT_752929 [Mycena epipterygia]|nr:hypothetical protein C8R44DRAFT_752929 [Mycena epipterygia]